MIKAILFDFNGVIIDDEPIQLKAYQEVLKDHDISLTEEDYYSSLGMDDLRFVAAAFGRAGKPLPDLVLEDVIQKKSAVHRSLIEDELPLFPGVVTFVKASAREFPLGLVSMARRTEIDYVLERAGLRQSFKVIVSADDVKACKPDPAAYNLAFLAIDQSRRESSGLSISPNECLVIEDAPPGIEAGRKAGMRTLGVTNTVSEDALRKAGAEVVTQSLSDWTTDAVRHVFDR
jgi:HAD superfamily hydrolase (TIGR01509 family)